MAAGAAARHPRAALSRERILQAALDYSDKHGLAALSMHKLGAELGVKGMSLYHYVAGKDDILDALVGLLWSEIDPHILEHADWRAASRGLAHALRDLVHRHPNSASLLMNRRVTSASQLRLYGAYLNVLYAAGFERSRARELLRILVAYGFGYAQTELAAFAAPSSDERLHRILTELPTELLEVAHEVCCGTDTTAQFALGLDLMLRGLESRETTPG